MQEIDTIPSFKKWLGSNKKKAVAVQSLDLTSLEEELHQKDSSDCLFLGCRMSDDLAGHLVRQGAMVILESDKVKFQLHRAKLYTAKELFKGFDSSLENGYHSTFDYQIYSEYLQQGKDKPSSIQTSLFRRLHDHSITEALEDAIRGEKVVAIMGGHGMERSDPFYLKIAHIARILTQKGFLLVTGGGPGAMEATHFGAYFAERSYEDMIAALNEIKIRPKGAKKGKEYNDPDWLARALKVMKKYPIPKGKKQKSKSIGIPTWLYGHEPPAPFATHIAKYFANSVREEGLLAIATYGVIFAPGSAGTTQEIFQDACQNHYGSMEYVSPMILFGTKRWTKERPVWKLLQKVAKGKLYGELLALTDNEEEVIRRILSYQADLYRI